MFVFNNVKSNIKNTFYQPTKAKSNTKMLSLYRLSPYRKPRLAEGGQTYIMIKGVFVRFDFDVQESGSSRHNLSKTKQCRTPHEVYYILSSLASYVLSFVVNGAFYILTLAWGFRRCSFRQIGRCQSLYTWNERQNRLHA